MILQCIDCDNGFALDWQAIILISTGGYLMILFKTGITIIVGVIYFKLAR